MLKFIEPMVWYTDLQLKDPYKNSWKGRIKQRPKTLAKMLGSAVGNTNSVTTTTFFVPPSVGSELFREVVEVEKKCSLETNWKMKIMEKSGKPLINFFMRGFPMAEGCPRGKECM